MSGGNCPETPRQKMIGMMYLMLTAMLALNVSGDLLNAFDLVDRSIRKQTEATDGKLGTSFANFEAKNAQNPARVKPKYDLALEVKAKADSLYNLIQNYKQEIIWCVDGKDSGSTPENYLNKSDQDKPAQIMIVERGGERAKILKESLNTFRDEMAALTSAGDSTMPADSALAVSIQNMINTDDGRSETDGSLITWESQNFEHLPVAACMGLMSAMQSNVRNVETDVVNYLYKAIDAASFKFNVLVPLIIPEAQYVLQGSNYKADIMLAAYDDTMEPIVSVGGSQLEVESGKGKYSVPATSVGMKSYTAKLEIPDPVTGNLIPYVVEGNYEVGAPNLVVSPTKMNAMYRGLNNPIEVSVAGVSPSDLSVSCTGGNLSKGSEGFIVKPGSGKVCSINVSSNVNGKVTNLGHKDFRVFDVPNPEVVVKGVDERTGKLKKSASTNLEVVAELKDFLFDVSFTVTHFEVSTTKNGFLVSEKADNTSKLNAKQMALIKGTSRGNKVYVESVRAKGPDGRERRLNGVSIQID